MTICKKLFTAFTKARYLNPQLIRCYATIVEKELEVPTFCDVHVDVPYSVALKPVDIHKYHNCDKLLVQIDERCEDSLRYEVDGNRVTIIDNFESKDNDLLMKIKAPVKSNLYVHSKKDITVGYFHGDKLYLESAQGDITVDKYQGNLVDLTTDKGNVNVKDFIQASNINIEVLKHGCISCGRLQSLNLRLITKLGNISVQSLYSHDNHFEIEEGNLELHNAHKDCKIFIKDGNVNLTGFDGKLLTVLDKGSANIQIVRLIEDSEINILNGTLNLKLAEACQDFVQIKLKSKDWSLADNLKLTVKNFDNSIVLTPDVNDEHTLAVNCMNGHVHIDSASWQDMVKMKLKK